LKNLIKKYKHDYEKTNKDMNDLLLKFDQISNTLNKEKNLNEKLQTKNKAMKSKIKELLKCSYSYDNKIDNNEATKINEKLLEISKENKNLKIENKDLYNSSIKNK
jgi:hypothetical protein